MDLAKTPSNDVLPPNIFTAFDAKNDDAISLVLLSVATSPRPVPNF